MVSLVAKFETPVLPFLGILKSQVYVIRPESLKDLKAIICRTTEQTPPVIIDNIRNKFIHHLDWCQPIKGAQLEHLILWFFKL